MPTGKTNHLTLSVHLKLILKLFHHILHLLTIGRLKHNHTPIWHPPPLKDGDSLYRTAMPDRKNVLCRVYIAVVSDTTLTTSPFSYSQPIYSLRTAKRATTRTGAGGVRLVDFLENNACVSALIFQHCF